MGKGKLATTDIPYCVKQKVCTWHLYIRLNNKALRWEMIN